MMTACDINFECSHSSCIKDLDLVPANQVKFANHAIVLTIQPMPSSIKFALNAQPVHRTSAEILMQKRRLRLKLKSKSNFILPKPINFEGEVSRPNINYNFYDWRLK